MKSSVKKSLLFVWKTRLSLRAEGSKLYVEGSKLWAEGNKRYAEGDILCAEGNELYAEGDKLCVEGDRLHAEGDKLWDEGYKLWAEAIPEFVGNVAIEWTADGCKVAGELFKNDAKDAELPVRA